MNVFEIEGSPMIQYALWVWLTYLLTFGALVGVFVASMWLLGISPGEDRSFVFAAGGGGLMIATVILGAVALILYATMQPGG